VTAFLSWWAGALIELVGGGAVAVGLYWLLKKRFGDSKSPPGRRGDS
jgi:hypothetical protein